MPRVVHFEIAANDPEHAVQFYATVFGWHIQKSDGSQDGCPRHRLYGLLL